MSLLREKPDKKKDPDAEYNEARLKANGLQREYVAVVGKSLDLENPVHQDIMRRTREVAALEDQLRRKTVGILNDRGALIASVRSVLENTMQLQKHDVAPGLDKDLQMVLKELIGDDERPIAFAYFTPKLRRLHKAMLSHPAEVEGPVADQKNQTIARLGQLIEAAGRQSPYKPYRPPKPFLPPSIGEDW